MLRTRPGRASKQSPRSSSPGETRRSQEKKSASCSMHSSTPLLHCYRYVRGQVHLVRYIVKVSHNYCPVGKYRLKLPASLLPQTERYPVRAGPCDSTCRAVFLFYLPRCSLLFGVLLLLPLLHFLLLLPLSSSYILFSQFSHLISCSTPLVW